MKFTEQNFSSQLSKVGHHSPVTSKFIDAKIVQPAH